MSDATITILFLLFAIIFFVSEIIPLAITAMLLSVGLALTGVLPAKDAFAGFVDSNVLLFMAMFIIGAAIFETGMAKRIGGYVTRFAKTESHLIIALMLITGLMSGLLSNTGTAAVLIPMVLGIAQKTGFNKKRLLLPLVIAAAMGGNLSLICAPGNLIAQAGLQQMGLSFGFFEFAKVGLPILGVGILYFVFFGQKLLPNTTSEDVAKGDSINFFDQEQDESCESRWKQNVAFIVLVLTVLAMVFEKKLGVPLFVSAWAGALILIVSGVISENSAMRSIDMKTIMLFVGSLSLAVALNKSGAGEIIAGGMINLLGSDPSPFIVLLVVFLVAVVLTNFMSNTATTALLVPICLAIAEQLQADPKAVLMATVIGGSLAYATPIGMPANTMIYGIGNYRFMDYVKVGLPLIVLAMVVALVLLPIIFPFFPNH